MKLYYSAFMHCVLGYLLVSPVSYADAPSPRNAKLENVTQISPGLSYSEFNCTVNQHKIELQQIQLQPNSTLQVRAISNPGASVDYDCRGNYGGTDLSRLLREYEAKKNNFRIQAVTNGNFFHTQSKSKGRMGFAPNGMLWSKAPGGEGTLLAGLKLKGGKDLLITDDAGAHQISLVLENCEGQTCGSLAKPEELGPNQKPYFFRKMKTKDFVKAIRSAFPKITLVAQLNMDLSGGHLDKDGNLIHFSQCEERAALADESKDDDVKAYWKCQELPRTILCGRRDGTVSLLTTQSAYVYDLAVGLREKGKCFTECHVLFNLDGGGSTQMGFLNPSTKKFTFSGVPHGESPYSIAQDKKKIHCGSLRPVDHYLAIGSEKTFPSK